MDGHSTNRLSAGWAAQLSSGGLLKLSRGNMRVMEAPGCDSSIRLACLDRLKNLHHQGSPALNLQSIEDISQVNLNGVFLNAKLCCDFTICQTPQD
jgi:hypothetical protein